MNHNKIMPEVTYQVGIDRKIVYKEGMEQEGRYYQTRVNELKEWERSNPLINMLISTLWVIFGIFIGMTFEGQGIVYAPLCCLALFWPFLPSIYYNYRHGRCVKEIIETPIHAIGNTSNRGWWKW